MNNAMLLSMTTTTTPVSNIYRQSPPISAATTGLPRLQPSASPHQITHSMPQEKLHLFKSLEPWVSKHVLPLVKPVEKSWQPIDFLPDPTKPITDLMDEIWALQYRTIGLPDEYFVVLVGNMIIEEALPTYQTVINTFDGVRDETGASLSPWAVWTRAWTAEENRHGDLLKMYLYLSGRVNMRMVEKTVQYLISAGMDGEFENNPYLGFVYASFQERATFLAHGKTAELVKRYGDSTLATICGTIAADEKRHQNVYTKIIEKLLEVDSNETMLAIGKMLRRGVKMPGTLMYDGQDTNLFEHFSTMSQRLGINTTNSYVDLLEYFIKRWKLDKLEGLEGNGRHEQEYVCRLPNRIRKLNNLVEERGEKTKPQKLQFSWIFNKKKLVI